MTKNLEMIFVNAAGGKVILRVAEPKDNLQASEVQTVMNQIVNKDIFISSGGRLTGIAGARVVSRDVTELNIV